MGHEWGPLWLGMDPRLGACRLAEREPPLLPMSDLELGLVGKPRFPLAMADPRLGSKMRLRVPPPLRGPGRWMVRGRKPQAHER